MPTRQESGKAYATAEKRATCARFKEDLELAAPSKPWGLQSSRPEDGMLCYVSAVHM